MGTFLNCVAKTSIPLLQAAIWSWQRPKSLWASSYKEFYASNSLNIPLILQWIFMFIKVQYNEFTIEIVNNEWTLSELGPVLLTKWSTWLVHMYTITHIWIFNFHLLTLHLSNWNFFFW
jgi:hypothetical protein